jgi:hypothetical protein
MSPANDNQNPIALNTQKQDSLRQPAGGKFKVTTDLPERLPITEGELLIIEQFFGNLIQKMIANDN